MSIIPNVVHQIWLGGNPPPRVVKLTQEFRRQLRPDAYFFWTDENIGGFEMVEKDFYKSTKNLAIKADLLRIEIIFKYGGFYFDCDFVGISPLKNFLYQFSSMEEIFTSENVPGMVPFIQNCVFGAAPKNDVVKLLLESIDFDASANPAGRNEVMNVAGPLFFDRVLKSADVKPISSEYFLGLPSRFRGLALEDVRFFARETSVAIHLWDMSW